jgi:hypothetical protein
MVNGASNAAQTGVALLSNVKSFGNDGMAWNDEFHLAEKRTKAKLSKLPYFLALFCPVQAPRQGRPTLLMAGSEQSAKIVSVSGLGACITARIA